MKYIVVTGGVLSGLGKGVVAASIGRLLSSKYKIVPIKCDGYLNVDPGTMNPVEHGEVFVLDDGGEVDLDFGHYERFLNINCKKEWNLTSGKVFLSLMEKERRGDFLGKTVQVIPHVTGEIRQRIQAIGKKEKADIVLVEIGGTVGDIENLWFLEACRELVRDVGRENILFVHLGLVPSIDTQGEQKTKPLQQSINQLRERGIFPEVIVGRSEKILTDRTKQKLHWLCNVEKGAVISDPDLDFIYELPLIFEQEGLREIVCKKFKFPIVKNMGKWKKLVNAMKQPKKRVSIAICGKYTELADSYMSIIQAFRHCEAHFNCLVDVVWLETSDVETATQAMSRLKGIDGVVVAPGFGSRGTEGKIHVVNYVRTHNIPFLGICYGLQLAVVEFARNVCGLDNANSSEINPKAPYLVVDILPEQRGVIQKGGTMRLGDYVADVKKGSKVSKLYKSSKVHERHRHRYEVNPEYHGLLESKGLVFSGMSPDKRLVEFIELVDHPYFVATQAHPELKSRLERPAPLFLGLVGAALRKKYE